MAAVLAAEHVGYAGDGEALNPAGAHRALTPLGGRGTAEIVGQFRCGQERYDGTPEKRARAARRDHAGP